MDINKIEKHSKINSVSGNEGTFLNVILKELKSEFYKHFFDSTKNLYLKDDSNKYEKNIVVVCSIDEKGFVVSKINDDGTLSILNQGRMYASSIENSEINLTNSKNQVFSGIIQCCEKDNKSKTKILKVEDLICYVGFKNREEAEKNNIKPGNIISFKNNFTLINKKFIYSHNIHSKIIPSLLIDNIKEIKSNFNKNKFGLCLVFMSQIQIGNRGAYTILDNIQDYDFVLNLDVTNCHNFLDKKNKVNYGNINKGILLHAMDSAYITKFKNLQWFSNFLSRNKINFKPFFSNIPGASGVISMSRSSVNVVPISIPCHYKYGTTCLVSISDIKIFENFLINFSKNINIFDINNINEFD